MGLAGLLGGTAGALVLLNTPAADVYAPGPMAAAGGRLDFRGQRAGVALARAPQSRQSRPERAASGGPNLLFHDRGVFLHRILRCRAGFLLITMLSLFGCQDLHEINALKVVSTTLANGLRSSCSW